jgi:hypothetical protein
MTKDKKDKTGYAPPLHIDMPFSEALERLAGVDPKEVQANEKRSKQKKPPGGKKPPPDDPTNVSSLRDARSRKRNRGRV